MKINYMFIFISLFVLFLIGARLSKYYEFRSAKIDGTIGTIYRYRDYVMIYVNGIEYRIIPVSLNNAPRLDAIARVGDSLYKQAGSDSLRLIHESDEAFEYTVKKW